MGIFEIWITKNPHIGGFIHFDLTAQVIHRLRMRQSQYALAVLQSNNVSC